MYFDAFFATEINEPHSITPYYHCNTQSITPTNSWNIAAVLASPLAVVFSCLSEFQIERVVFAHNASEILVHIQYMYWLKTDELRVAWVQSEL
jgi:hypothetical protein